MINLNNLPEPLSQDQIIFLYKQYQEGNLEAKKIILNHNIKLIINLVQKNFNRHHYDIEELTAIGLLGITECFDKYDLSRNVNFSTFAVHCARMKIIAYLKKQKLSILCISMSDFINVDNLLKDNSVDIEYDYELKEEHLIIRQLVEGLKEKEQLIVKLYFGFENRKHTQKEISEILNVSPQRVQFVLKKALEKLKIKFQEHQKII